VLDLKIMELIAAGGDLATVGVFLFLLNMRGRIIKLETIMELLLKGHLKDGKKE